MAEATRKRAKLFKKKFVRWFDSRGIRVKAGTAGATKVTEESADWYGSVFEPRERRWIQVRLSSDEGASLTQLRELKAELARSITYGLPSPFERTEERALICRRCDSSGTVAAEGKRRSVRKRSPCEHCDGAHLSDFRQSLSRKERSPKHVLQTINRLAVLFKACGFRTAGELGGDKIEAWLADQREAGLQSKTTSNYYLGAAKQFGTWLQRHRNWPSNPFGKLAKLNAEDDAQHVRRGRRVFSADELAWLIRTTETSTVSIRGLNGHDRAAIYATAALTGLRANELASLTAKSFDLGSDEPTVTVEAFASKRRRRDVLPVHPDLIYRLRELLDGRELETIPLSRVQPRVWPGSWATKAAEILAEDMATAREAWLLAAEPDERKRLAETFLFDDRARREAWIREGETAAERRQRRRSRTECPVESVLDFHALRHTFITSVVKSGAHPKQAQRLARHSKIELTMNHYTHLSLLDDRTALSAVPGIAQPTPREQRATGTDGKKNSAVDEDGGPQKSSRRRLAARMDARTGVRACPNLSTNGHEPVAADSRDSSGFPEENAVFSKEALVGVEPTVADLQSAALATWLQRLRACRGRLGCESRRPIETLPRDRSAAAESHGGVRLHG